MKKTSLFNVYVFMSIVINYQAIDLRQPQNEIRINESSEVTTRLVYRLFAILSINVVNDDYDSVFERLSNIIKQRSDFDPEDPYTSAQLEALRSGKPDAFMPHFPFQYMDKSGAKITVYLSLPAENHSKLKAIEVLIGYGEERISDQQLTAKIAQINHDIESSCNALATECVVTRRPLIKIPGQ